MKMPTHMFISMCNILASQFKKEAEEQEKERENATSDMPNLRQFADFSSIASNLGLSNLNIPGL
jgi:hypothetical protein